MHCFPIRTRFSCVVPQILILTHLTSYAHVAFQAPAECVIMAKCMDSHYPESGKHRTSCYPEAQAGMREVQLFLLTIWLWLKIKRSEGQTAGFGPCFHLPGFHLGTIWAASGRIGVSRSHGWAMNRLAIEPNALRAACVCRSTHYVIESFGGFSTWNSEPFLGGLNAPQPIWAYFEKQSCTVLNIIFWLLGF